MDRIKLVMPSVEYGADVMAFREEVTAAQDEDSFAGCGSLRTCGTMEQWLELLHNREHAETCPKGGVPSNTYLAVRRSDNRIVGIIDLRHHINHPILGLWGGHIGYTVRPSERRKGYAKEMLRLDLENCRARGIPKVMITCSESNPASEKVIIANGGIFEKTVSVDGDIIKRYWINLGSENLC